MTRHLLLRVNEWVQAWVFFHTRWNIPSALQTMHLFLLR
jgi:hypothetical protein